MKKFTKILVGFAGLLGAAAQVPAVQHVVANALSGHPAIVGALAAVSTILALVHDPNAK